MNGENTTDFADRMLHSDMEQSDVHYPLGAPKEDQVLDNAGCSLTGWSRYSSLFLSQSSIAPTPFAVIHNP